MNKRQNRPVGMLFIISMIAVLAIVFILIISVTITMMADTEDLPYDTSGTEDTVESTPTSDTASISAGLDNTPLFQTVKSRDSYVIGQATEVKQIEKIKSQHAILIDLSSYTSVAEKEADTKIYPASMTKVMTLIVACERVTSLDKKLTVTDEMVKFAEDNDGSGVGLKAGESYRIEDLLYLISYQSDTIASILIAEHIAGSEEAFVALMNSTAKQLGLTSTNFANCTGLYNDNNYTTCREMAAIMAYAMDNPMVSKCLSSYTGRPLTVGGTECMFYSGWYSYRFSDNPKFSGGKVIAGKTGYTDESGYTLVSCADIGGKKYINVIITRTNKDSTVKVQEGPSADEVKYIYKTYS